MIKKFKNYAIGIGILLLVLIGISIYKFVFSPTVSGGGIFNILFLAIGLFGGAVLVWFFTKGKLFSAKPDEQKIDASVILQKIERVFKVVTAEGFFSEVFDYSQTSHFANFIPSTKKALLIVNAKVLMGYDFKKCKFEIDADTGKVKILSFPAPEILSMEPDIKYYNMENGLFNKFDNADLTKLQGEAKQKIIESVAKSDLAAIAQSQVKELLLELKEINHWQLIGDEKIQLLNAPSSSN